MDTYLPNTCRGITTFSTILYHTWCFVCRRCARLRRLHWLIVALLYCFRLPLVLFLATAVAY